MANPTNPTNLTPEQQAQLAALLGQFQVANEPPKVKTPDEALDEAEDYLKSVVAGNLPFSDALAACLLDVVRALRQKYG